MELRQLKYFLEAARELHFGRAAENLCISQPALTKQINLIEQELGIELFDKTKRLLHKKVELTEAGLFLLKDASRFTEQFDRMLENTKKLGSKAKQINLGFYRLLPKSQVIELTQKVQEWYPDSPIKLVEYNTAEGVQEGLIRDDIALGITHFPLLFPNLSPRYTESNCLKVLLPSKHPLANYKKIKIEQLRNERWIEVQRNLYTLYDEVERRCKTAGFHREPQIVQEVSSTELLVGLVGMGMGVALVSSSLPITGDSVVLKDLTFSDNPTYATFEITHAIVFKKVE